jgi:hypothetical protein
MKALVVSLLLFAISFGVYAGSSFIYVKNSSNYVNLKVDCVSQDEGVKITVRNNTIKPRGTGIIEINSNKDGKNFEINLKTSYLDKTMKLKTEVDFFNNNGFVYNDDYTDDNISGEIKENQFYRISSIEV